MTKYQDLKNEVKRSWNLKNAKVVPVMMKNLMGMTTKNLTEILTRAALGAVEPLGRHQYLKHELHAIGPSITLSKYSTLRR